ncbi:MAG: isoaspartyl peptidase/L-asparaginase family protein [Cryomorphaceae bacterium]
MKNYIFLSTVWLISALSLSGQNAVPAIVIHGGAGTIERGMMTDSAEAEIRAALQAALDVGYTTMENGGSALEAVAAAIGVLEDAPQFNAGRGAVMTSEGRHELDASVMDGSNLNAGAVAGVTTVKNPLRAAIAVMEKSPHVLLSGAGAETFAREQGLEQVENDYFTVPRIRKRYDAMNKDQGQLTPAEKEVSKFGTVGAVAVDSNGNIAAGTSTGGMMNKRFGRIGDSPLIGAGTYADNATCGVSCTGHGEYFIRIGVAKDVADQMEYGGKTLEQATRHTIHSKLTDMKGGGGLIALDADGNISMEFNTSGMYRGFKNENESKVEIYKEE